MTWYNNMTKQQKQSFQKVIAVCAAGVIFILSIPMFFQCIQSSMLSIAQVKKPGKAHEDGYRGVHVYFQLSNYHYPIEIQYNTYYYRQLNNWLHKYVYKRKYNDMIGRTLRKEYENGKIRLENEFMEVLKRVLSDSKEI